MDPRKKLAALQAEAAALRVKMNENTLTDADRARVTAIADEAEVLRTRIAADEDLTAKLNAAAAVSGHTVRTGDGETIVTGGKAGSTGAFTGKMLSAFTAAAGTVGGPTVGKALIPAGSVVSDFDGRVVHDPMAAHTLLAAVNVEQTEQPAGQYLRQALRENNAATVANGKLKPLSNYGLEPKSWRLATVAHLASPIQRQLLQDYPMLERFLSTELAYGVNSALEDFIVNGSDPAKGQDGDEDGNPVTGVLTTSGVFHTDYTTNALLSIRRALRQAEEVGTVPTGIAVTPSDWEALDTLQLTDQGFLLAGAPTTQPARSLWGVPVTVTNGLPAGTALVGNLKAITLRYRNSLQLSWSESTLDRGTEGAPDLVDLFRRNQLVFRAETRVALEIASVKDLRVVELVAPAGA